MIIDADIHVTRDTIDNLRGRLPERYRQRERYFNQDEYDRGLGGTLGKHGLSAEQHLADMALEGIDVQVLFPTGMLGYGNNREAELAVALCRAYNDWLHEFCQADPRRFKGVALMPLQDVRAAIAELHRAVTDLGMLSVMIPTTVYPGKDLGGRSAWACRSRCTAPRRPAPWVSSASPISPRCTRSCRCSSCARR
jgi:predicted TIM-barrel fold metal-dependent hydrolase